MAEIIVDDKYYKAYCDIIRRSLKIDTQFLPSEIALQIPKLNQGDSINIVNGVDLVDGKIQLIGDSLFEGMFCGMSLTKYEVPTHINILPSYCFAHSSLNSITFHDNITTFKSYCFAQCKNLYNIPFPKNLNVIEQNAFYFSALSDKIILPEGLVTIGSLAFSGSNIVSIEIPSTVEDMKYSPFSFCSKLKTFIIRKNSEVIPIWASSSYPYFYSSLIHSGSGYIYVPSSLIENYKTASYWSVYSNQFRALEEYTIDGTITGKFDYSKI